MSWKASAWAKEQRLGSPAAKSILLCLADYADPEKATCWPSQTQLAADAEVSERTAREWLQRLEDWGLISRERRTRSNGARASDMIVLRLGVRVADGAERCKDSKVSGGDGDSSLPAEISGRTYRQPDAEPTGNETQPTGNQCRAYKEEPSIEPTNGTSQQGAQARERGDLEDPKKIEADGWALLKNWPQFDGMPKEPALKIWITLPADERATARRRFLPWLELLRKQGKSRVPSPSTYLRERLWQAAPDPADLPPAPKMAAPFGKVWTGRWISICLAGPGSLPSPSRFIASLIAQGGEAGERERLAHQARYGFPAVARMAEAARDRGSGCVIRADEAWLEAACAGFEQVHARSDLAAEWRTAFEQRGWPWLPDPGGHEWFYFPAGGPEALGAFEQAIRGHGTDDGARSEAAE